MNVSGRPKLEHFFRFITNRANVLESANRSNNHVNNIISSRMLTSQRVTPDNDQINKHGPNKGNTVKSFASTSNNNKSKGPKGFS